MTLEDIWRRKGDEEIVAASNRLVEYTEAGQRAILAELQRRRELGLLAESFAVDVPADGDDSHRPSDRTLAPRHGVFVSLWRGDVPLRTTYWVCGVLTNVVWLILLALAAVINSLALLALVAVLHFLYSVLITVAIWRSAGRYRGKRIWGDLARVSVALGVIGSFANLFVRK
jgi:hypothetical protein